MPLFGLLKREPRPISLTSPANQAGIVTTMRRFYAPTSNFSLIADSHSNLSINSTTGQISATSPIISGQSQKAVVRETLGFLAAEYPVIIAGSTPDNNPGGLPLGLPPMGYDGVLWDWDNHWHASEWTNPYGPLPWKYDHVFLQGTDVVMRLDASGAPEIQAMTAPGTNFRKGLWEAEVTLPNPRAGVIQAPLWLYDNDSGDEIDFEIVGLNGLQVAFHVKRAQHHSQLVTIPNLFGRKIKLGIKMDQDAGYVDMLVDGVLVHKWERSVLPTWIDRPLKPWFSLWAVNPNDANLVSWAGSFTGFTGSDNMDMIVHGYRFSTF